jgi:hypothetical protein
MKNKNIIHIAIVVGLILLIPLVLTLTDSGVEGDGWHWTLGDFIFAFVLLFGSGLAYELISRKSGATVYKTAVGVAIATAFFLTWVNAAVGIIGDNNPVNMLYPLVVAISIIGAAMARLQAEGMSRVLFVTAIAQMVVPVIALIIGTPDFSPGVIPVFVLNAGFATMWIGSALLFRRASATTSNQNPQLLVTTLENSRRL